MQLVRVSLENEMDLTLAYRKSIKAAELLGLSLATQTAFATAISEVCREIIDKTYDGLASIEVQKHADRLNLAAVITYTESPEAGNLSEGLQYAKKLVPVFNFSVADGCGTIELRLAIPRAALVDEAKIQAVKNYFKTAEPSSPYEEIRQRNEHLFEINEQSEMALKHAELLNIEKNEFLSVASHELRTPLTILKAYTQLAMKSECSPRVSEYLIKVDKQAQKMQTLIQQLLDVSKIGDGKADYNKEQVDFNSYVDEILELAPKLVPGFELIISSGSSSSVYLDKLRIEQVITNIISNAAKYSPESRQIKICIRELHEEILFSVQDWGIGMSEDELKKVFGKFYRVEEVTKRFNGLGVGLYVSSRIITDHGGEIWVNSAAGMGSTFSFTLPCCKPEPISSHNNM